MTVIPLSQLLGSRKAHYCGEGALGSGPRTGCDQLPLIPKMSRLQARGPGLLQAPRDGRGRCPQSFAPRARPRALGAGGSACRPGGWWLGRPGGRRRSGSLRCRARRCRRSRGGGDPPAPRPRDRARNAACFRERWFITLKYAPCRKLEKVETSSHGRSPRRPAVAAGALGAYTWL